MPGAGRGVRTLPSNHAPASHGAPVATRRRRAGEDIGTVCPGWGAGGRRYAAGPMGIDAATRTDLAELVRARGYEHRAEPFQLTSGGWSHDYVDGKHAVAAGADLKRVAEAAIAAIGEPFNAVGGPTMGADALAHAVSVLSGTGWFSIRKEPKGHGRNAWVEGTRLVEGDRVLVVEDVVSTGASLLRGVERLHELGAVVVAATALLDRSPQVAARFADAGVVWKPLLTWEDLGIAPL